MSGIIVAVAHIWTDRRYYYTTPNCRVRASRVLGIENNQILNPRYYFESFNRPVSAIFNRCIKGFPIQPCYSTFYYTLYIRPGKTYAFSGKPDAYFYLSHSPSLYSRVLPYVVLSLSLICLQ